MNRAAAVVLVGLLASSAASAQAQESAPPSAAPAAEAPAPPTLDKPPRLVRFVEAAAPPALASRGHAEVILLIDVNEKGEVERVEVATNAGDGFDEAAVAAARQFVFEPGEAGGKKVAVRITYRYRFIEKPKPPIPAEPEPAPAKPDEPPPAAALPETAPLAGFVHRKGDRLPLQGVVVALDSGELETVTDAAGRFELGAVPVGEHALKLRGGDITAVDIKVTVKAGRRVEVRLYVTARERYVSRVRGDRPIVETLEQTLSQEEIKKIPGTQGDTLKAVQNLPGVARSAYGLGQLIVWGSRPQDTRTYVDGVYIPTLFHFAGLRSTVNSEMVQSLTFTPGAYSAERGLGTGGLVDVTTRAPRRDGFHGYAQLDLIDGSLMVEGPIGKQLAFAAALRRSVIDVALPLFTRGRDLQLSPAYWDYQLRLSYKPTSRDELGLFVFGSDDQLSLLQNASNPALAQQFDSHTYYVRGVLTWLRRFSNSATLSLTSSVGYEVPFQTQTQSATGTQAAHAQIASYTLRGTARVPLTSFLRFDAGLDFEGNYITLDRDDKALVGGGVAMAAGMDPSAQSQGATTANELTLYTNHLAAFASASFSLLDRHLSITPQLRLQLFSFLGYPGTENQSSSIFFAPDPRIQARYDVLPWLAFKAAFGLFHQAPQPQTLSAINGNPQLAPEQALHYVAGVEFRSFSQLHIGLDAFYKDLRNLVVRGQTATEPRFVNEGLGRVYGGELLLRLDPFHNLFGWVSYTLMRSERLDHPGSDWRIFELDQTHILTLIASYKLPYGFQVGLRFRYVTGNPTTPILAASYDSNTDRYIPVLGELNSERLTAFHQLDLRIDKVFTFDRWRLSLYLDVQNVYYASNPEGISYNFNYTQQSPINGLPIFPALGIRGDF